MTAPISILFLRNYETPSSVITGYAAAARVRHLLRGRDCSDRRLEPQEHPRAVARRLGPGSRPVRAATPAPQRRDSPISPRLPLKSVTKAEAERRAREEKEYWDGWYRLLSCGTAPNLRDAESKTKPGAKAGVAGYADSDDEVDEYPGEGSSVGKCRVHGAWTGCAISCCCQEPTRRSRSFQDLREAVTPNASPRTSPRSSPSRGKKN